MHACTVYNSMYKLMRTVPTIVSIISDIPNPILSGSSPTLTCAVEFTPVLNGLLPIPVYTVWTGPDGTTVIHQILNVKHTS